ncbi:MAG: AprI/Inh family metalloprotease inhibitor [Xanthobacteraceae bacterium]
MHRQRIGIVVAMAGCLCGGVAFAQDVKTPDVPAPRDPVAAMIGNWQFSNADQDKVCHFVFRNDPAPGGYKLDIDKNCPNLFPSTKNIVGWTIDNFGSLRLLDSAGKAVIELSEVETGMFDGFRREEGRYILQNAASIAPAHTTADLAGDWAIERGTGKPICVLTLVNKSAGADDFALQVKPGCDALVTRFNPTSWRLDDTDLMLLTARGQSWRFEENDPNTWERVPQGPDPMLLVRQ